MRSGLAKRKRSLFEILASSYSSTNTKDLAGRRRWEGDPARATCLFVKSIQAPRQHVEEDGVFASNATGSTPEFFLSLASTSPERGKWRKTRGEGLAASKQEDTFRGFSALRRPQRCHPRRSRRLESEKNLCCPALEKETEDRSHARTRWRKTTWPTYPPSAWGVGPSPGPQEDVGPREELRRGDGESGPRNVLENQKPALDVTAAGGCGLNAARNFWPHVPGNFVRYVYFLTPLRCVALRCVARRGRGW